MGYGWLGCTSDYERPDALQYDYGNACAACLGYSSHASSVLFFLNFLVTHVVSFVLFTDVCSESLSPSHLQTGVPTDPVCRETGPGTGMFTRKWSKATVTLDCTTFMPNITVDGHGTIPVPPPPAPPPPPPPPPPSLPCADPVAGYDCSKNRCSSDGTPSPGHCGPDLCWPNVTLPSLCALLPSPLSAAVAEAKRRCDGYQLCHSFGIDTSKFGPHCKSSPSACQKFFQAGKEALDPVPDSWVMWVQKS